MPKELKNRKKMINIKKLHLVHKYYPNVPRRFGKTTYCYDSLLRASETGTYKNIAYITSKTDFAGITTSVTWMKRVKFYFSKSNNKKGGS